MRERTTWDRKMNATDKHAEDPRAMNQDHHSQQPSADEYVIGGPSEFAEDIHPAAGTWKAEQSGGETSRNEIGMPAMRSDTFNHPEKTAGDDEAVLKKADLCVKVARQMLPRGASSDEVEDQALSLMNLPAADLINTSNRLAAKISDDDDKDDDDDDDGKQAGELPPALKKHMEEKGNGKGDDDDKDDDDDDDKQQKQQQKEALRIASTAYQAGDQATFQKAVQAMATLKVQAAQKAAHKAAQKAAVEAAQMAMQQDQQAMDGHAMMDQQAIESMIQEQVQQAMQNQGLAWAGDQQALSPPMAQQDQQALSPPMAAQQPQMSDDQMLDQMLQQELAPEQQMPIMANESDIELQPSMDIGETQLGPEDAVLASLFADNPEVQQAAHAQELETGINPLAGIPAPPTAAPVTAGTTRTASTRTVGTRPTAGVSQLGGVAGGATSAQSDIDRLSSLWRTAPDVSNVFNT